MNKKVLILGGTGVIGKYVAELLSEQNYDVFVTSRKSRENTRITYLKGNAHDVQFLRNTISMYDWESVVDFMSYKTSEFSLIAKEIIPNVKQYIFTSSARIFAPSQEPITENTSRLIDVLLDSDYIMTDDYPLAKARQEDIVKSYVNNNWTIIRPSIIYGPERLQLPIGEKEDWLRRALCGKKIIFPKAAENIYTTMLSGEDAAKSISQLVGNENALGECFNIAGTDSITWGTVLKTYRNVLLEYDIPVEIEYIENEMDLIKYTGTLYQYKYARGVNRVFDNSKIFRLTGEIQYKNTNLGLAESLRILLDNQPLNLAISWKKEACFDRISHEKSKVSDFSSFNTYLKYFLGRYTPYFILTKNGRRVNNGKK